MLSLRILCAVDIISMLHIAYKYGGRGMKKSEIIAKGCMPLTMYNYVLCELSRTRVIIRRSTSRYYFEKPLSSVTLYDLSKILHQGIPIGEIITTNELRGSLTFKDQYQGLINAEKALVLDITRQMKNMKLSDLLKIDTSSEGVLDEPIYSNSVYDTLSAINI